MISNEKLVEDYSTEYVYLIDEVSNRLEALPMTAGKCIELNGLIVDLIKEAECLAFMKGYKRACSDFSLDMKG